MLFHLELVVLVLSECDVSVQATLACNQFHNQVPMYLSTSTKAATCVWHKWLPTPPQSCPSRLKWSWSSTSPCNVPPSAWDGATKLDKPLPRSRGQHPVESGSPPRGETIEGRTCASTPEGQHHAQTFGELSFLRATKPTELVHQPSTSAQDASS